MIRLPPGASVDFRRPRPVEWVGSSRQDLRDMPDPVRDAIGKALYYAQIGGKSPRAKPFHGCGGGAGVLEIVDDFDGDTYRAVYTVRFAEAVYVLHVFQKKSPRGTSTPRQDVELIRRRLREAEEDYRERYARKGGSSDGC